MKSFSHLAIILALGALLIAALPVKHVLAIDQPSERGGQPQPGWSSAPMTATATIAVSNAVTTTAVSTATSTATLAPASATPTATKTNAPAATATPTLTPTNKPAATATHTPAPNTATPTLAASATPTNEPTADPNEVWATPTPTLEPLPTEPPRPEETLIPTFAYPTFTPIAVPTRGYLGWLHFPTPAPITVKYAGVNPTPRNPFASNNNPAPSVAAVHSAPAAQAPVATPNLSGQNPFGYVFPTSAPTQVAVANSESPSPEVAPAQDATPPSDSAPADAAPSDSLNIVQRVVNVVLIGGAGVMLLAGGALGLLAAFFFLRAKLSD